MNAFSFELQKTIGQSRAGVMHTPHGDVLTPIFMPVGTRATVKALDSVDLENLHAQIILANTYHNYLRPGMDVFREMGGIHSYMHWNKPVLTDSGGFQVFSLGEGGAESLVHISEEGVEFTSHLDGSKHFFHPEDAIEYQRIIAPDIIMAFDQCTTDAATYSEAKIALVRTHDWAKRCTEYWEKHGRLSAYGKYQALFGIVQGALHKELRVEGAKTISGLGFDGVAVAGETVGYNMEGTAEVMSWIVDDLPKDKPRYAMGLGRDPDNLIQAVKMGFDMFDCVAPTRLARNGSIYSGKLEGNSLDSWYFASEFSKGRMQIGNAVWKFDQRPIMEGCDCYTCSHGYSRAYLRHLFLSKELTYYRLSSIHNVHFMVRLSQQLRESLMK